MEKRLVVGAALFFLLAVGAAAGASPESSPPTPRGVECAEETTEQRMPGGRMPVPDLGEALGLSEAQQTKVEALLDVEWAKAASIRKKIEENRRELRKVEQGAAFDEKGIRAVAAKEGELRAELTVLHARTRFEMRSLLTEGQRALFEELPPPPAPPEPGSPPPPRRDGRGLPGLPHPFPPEGE